VVKINNKEYKFKPKGKLYVYNAKPNKQNYSMMDDEVILAETVSNTETMCYGSSTKNAALAKQAQMRMGYPSVRDVVEGINKGRVLNLPITKNDLQCRAHLGKRYWFDRRETTHKRPCPVVI